MKFLFLLIACGFFVLVSSQHTQYARMYGGKWAGATGNTIAMDDAGNTYIGGSFKDTIEFSNIADQFTGISVGWTDMFLLKLDPNGTTIWIRTFGGTLRDELRDMEIDAAGNIYFIGNFEGTIDIDPGVGQNLFTSNGNSDVVFGKFDNNGNLLWAYSLGGITQNHGCSVKLVENGSGFLISGFAPAYLDSVDFDPGLGQNYLKTGVKSTFLMKLDLQGQFQWVKNIPGGFFSHIYEDIFGNIWLGGVYDYGDTLDFDPGPGELNVVYNGIAGFFQVYLLKFDANGNLIDGFFTESLPIDTIGGITMISLTGDRFGNIYYSGSYYGSLDLDPGPDTFAVTTGTALGGLSNGYYVKLDNNGNFKWANLVEGSGNEVCNKILVGEEGNLYIGGYFDYDWNQDSIGVDLDPGVGNFYISCPLQNNTISYIQKVDPNGNFVWAGAFLPSDSYGNTKLMELYRDDAGGVYATGAAAGRIDFEPGTDSLNLFSPLYWGNVFVVKLWASPVGVYPDVNTLFSLYPNPATEVLTLEFTGLIQQIRSVELLNSLGQVVYQNLPVTMSNNGNTIFIPVQGLLPGVYVCRVTTNNGSASRKVLIE